MQESSPRADLYLFFWLPKTGGGTLSAGIRENPGVRWLDTYPPPDGMPMPGKDQLWTGGHVGFGFHLIYDAEPVYFTVLRDPIERLISEFFYHHQHNLPGIFIPDHEMIPSFIRVVESAAHLNYYTYMFSGHCFEKESAEAGFGSWDGNPVSAYDLIRRRIDRYGYLTENIRFEDVDVDRAFRKASRNIRAMRFVGFFDQLHDTATYLKYEFGLKVGLDRRIHKTTWKPILEDLPAHVRRMLALKTEADYDFYHGARQAAAAPLRHRCG